MRPPALPSPGISVAVGRQTDDADLDSALSFRFISESPIVAKIQYWMKITFVFILILFIDSVNRVYRVQIELATATEQANKGG